MKNLKLKELIQKETEQLKTKEKNTKIIQNILWGIVIIVFCILGGYIGTKLAMNNAPGYRGLLIFLFTILGGVFGILISVIVVNNLFNPESIAKRTNKKAKEITIARLLPAFMQAFKQINTNEDLAKNLEEIIKKNMEDNDVTWYNSKDELKYYWVFEIDPFKFTLNNQNAFLSWILVEERINTSDKMVIEFIYTVEIEKKDNVSTYSDRRIFVTMD